MLTYSLTKQVISDARFSIDVTDVRLVDRMRLILSVSVLLAVFIDPSGLSATQNYTWLVFFGYLFHSIVIYVLTFTDHPFSHTVLPHRLDVIWFALIVASTGGVDSFFFLFFFFSILTSSFRWGYAEGAKVTVASTLLFISCGWLLSEENDLSRLLLRATFLLAIGYISVYWGESKVRLMHQLVLLREVSRLSNPRFGVNQTIANILDKTRKFYGANSCILVMQDKDSGSYSLRTVNEKNALRPVSDDPVNEEMASPFIAHSHDHLIAYSRPLWNLTGFFLPAPLAYDCTQQRWIRQEGHSNETLTELLGARSFMSTPVSLRKQRGRLYVVSDSGAFNKEDTLFLNQIVTQSFPVVESIECLDKLASDAASEERQKISLDIHDRTIQPYIGLQLGLNAIKRKASVDNPLIHDIDKLARMAEGVIEDLRRYAVTIKTGVERDKSMLHVVLQKEAARISDLYGIEISIVLENELQLNDRLAVEILQFIQEGLSNICRHTHSQRGAVTVNHVNGWVKILVKNESSVLPIMSFMPQSIRQRATRLGGNVQVLQESDGTTVVHIEIPV